MKFFSGDLVDEIECFDALQNYFNQFKFYGEQGLHPIYIMKFLNFMQKEEEQYRDYWAESHYGELDEDDVDKVSAAAANVVPGPVPDYGVDPGLLAMAPPDEYFTHADLEFDWGEDDYNPNIPWWLKNLFGSNGMNLKPDDIKLIAKKLKNKGIISLKKFYDLLITPEAYNFFMEFFNFKNSPKTLGNIRSECFTMINQYMMVSGADYPQDLSNLFYDWITSRKLEIAVMLGYEGVFSKERFFQKFDTKEKLIAYFKPYGITLEQADKIISRK